MVLQVSGVNITPTLYATSANLASTGSTLVTNLATTGSTLDTKINDLSGVSVLTFGDQTISGVKTFATGVNISGHVGIGINNNNFNLYVRKSQAGVTVNPDGDSIAVFEGSGNSHITVLASNAQTAGVVLGSPADNFGAYLTWNHDNNSLKLGTAKPSGFIQLLTDNETEALRITSGANVGIGTTSPSEKLQVVGNILANNLVYNTGNQTINGLKTFTSGIDIYSGASPQILRIFNSTGTNSGEFALIGWQRNVGIVSPTTNALVIGAQASNSGILRDVIITGENIALSPGSGRLYINGTASLNDHLLQTSPCSGNITGYITGLGFTGNYTGNYEGGYFLGRTKLSQNTVQLVDSSFGSNYVAKTAPAPNQIFNSAAVSSDGRYQVITSSNGYIYVSNDYGNTWTPRITDAIRTWARFSAAISADGKYQTVAHNDGYIYVSNDYGNTWNAKDSVRYWGAITISSDGKYQTAIVGGNPGGVWGSNDYGNTWIKKTSTPYLYCVSMSSDGKYQYLTLSYIGSSVFRSSDYGNNWTTIYNTSSLSAIATSADGKFVIVGRQGSQILISNNYGASFVTKSASADHYSVAISDNGKYMAAGVGNVVGVTGGIYFSSDYGNTWKLITPATGRWSVAMSSNGKYILAVNDSGSPASFYIFKTDELIDGNLTINNNLTLPSGDFYSYNATGVNSGEFGLIGWRNNQFVIGSQQSQSGILRDVVITGNNININGSGALNIFDNTNIVGNLVVSGSGIFTSGIDLNNSKLINATPDLLNVSANFNITGTQNSRVILANSPTIITGSIVSGNPIGFNTSIIQTSSGQVLITGIGSNVIVNSYNNQFRTAAQYATISILHTGNDGYIMYGNTST